MTVGQLLTHECVQLKAGAFSGGEPRQGNSQGPCSLSRRQ